MGYNSVHLFICKTIYTPKSTWIHVIIKYKQEKNTYELCFTVHTESLDETSKDLEK